MVSVKVMEVVRGGKGGYEIVILPNSFNTPVKTVGGRFPSRAAAEKYIKEHGGRQQLARKAFPKR